MVGELFDEQRLRQVTESNNSSSIRWSLIFLAGAEAVAFQLPLVPVRLRYVNKILQIFIHQF